MSDERRKFTRILFDMKGELISGDRLFLFEKISNLSIGGCLLPVDEKMDVGSEVELKFFLGEADGGPVIEIKGQVIRLVSNELAVRFTHIDPESLFHLQNVVRYNAEDSDAVEREIREHPGIV